MVEAMAGHRFHKCWELSATQVRLTDLLPIVEPPLVWRVILGGTMAAISAYSLEAQTPVLGDIYGEPFRLQQQ